MVDEPPSASPDSNPPVPRAHSHGAGPDEVGHTHANVAGGQLRAATFGAMDGLVTNLSLIAGVGGAGASAHTIILSGVSGLVAGAFSMALGEFTSVSTQNEQVDAEVLTEEREFATNPAAEKHELIDMFVDMGMSEETASAAADEIHADTERAVNFHLSQEIGVNPTEKPSPYVAAGSSFLCFSIGAVIPLIPYLLGFGSLYLGLLAGAIGLLVAGAMAAHLTAHPVLRGALRQLVFGFIAAGATYLAGYLIGVPASG